MTNKMGFLPHKNPVFTPVKRTHPIRNPHYLSAANRANLIIRLIFLYLKQSRS